MMQTCSWVEIVQRICLTVSNLMFLLPWIVIVRSKNRQTMWLECSLLLWTMTFSFLYHLCDSTPSCFQVCTLSWTTLHDADFILSYQLLATLAWFSNDASLTPFKYLHSAVALLANYYVIRILGLANLPSETCFIMAWVLMGIMPSVLLRLHIYVQKYGWRQLYLQHRKKRLLALVLLSSAVICKLIASASDYWLLHSLWHIFVASGLYFGLGCFEL